MLRVSFCVLIEIIYTCIYFRNVRKYTWCIGASISRIHFMTCFKRWRVLFLKKIALSQILPLQDWLNCNCRLYILNYFYWLFIDVHFSHKREIPYICYCTVLTVWLICSMCGSRTYFRRVLIFEFEGGGGSEIYFW